MTFSIQQFTTVLRGYCYRMHSSKTLCFSFQQHWEPPGDHQECGCMLWQAQFCELSGACPSPAHTVLQPSWKPGHLSDQPTRHPFDSARPEVRGYELLCLPFYIQRVKYLGIMFSFLPLSRPTVVWVLCWLSPLRQLQTNISVFCPSDLMTIPLKASTTGPL